MKITVKPIKATIELTADDVALVCERLPDQADKFNAQLVVSARTETDMRDKRLKPEQSHLAIFFALQKILQRASNPQFSRELTELLAKYPMED